MKNLYKLTFGIFIILFTVSSCKTAYEILEQGDYDRAINESVKKIRGKKKKKEDFVMVIEHALEKANERDMRRIKSLEQSGLEKGWEEIHFLYKDIARRQNTIQPLLPLYAKTGYKAEFRFVNVQPLIEESREKAASYMYALASEKLDGATNDKLLARESFDILNRLDRIAPDYRNINNMMADALHLGSNHVYVELQNNSGSIIPRALDYDLRRFSIGGLDSRWVRYHATKPDAKPDFTVIMNLREIRVSPESISERIFEQSKEIEEGFEYVLDQNGNVAKDTLGNDLIVPAFITVKAQVQEQKQFKEALLYGSLDFFDNADGNLVKSENIDGGYVFDNYASRYFGDERALSGDGRRYLNNGILPFPTDEEMIYDVVEGIKHEMQRTLKRHRRLFERI